MATTVNLSRLVLSCLVLSSLVFALYQLMDSDRDNFPDLAACCLWSDRGSNSLGAIFSLEVSSKLAAVLNWLAGVRCLSSADTLPASLASFPWSSPPPPPPPGFVGALLGSQLPLGPNGAARCCWRLSKRNISIS